MSTGVKRHLKASVGSTVPAKEHRAQNGPQGILRGCFGKIPASITFDVIGCTARFVLWTKQCIKHEGSKLGMFRVPLDK